MKGFFLFVGAFFCALGNAQFQQHTINLTTNDLVYDSVSNKIYASIPSSNGSNGNSIGVINPQTRLLQNTVFVGSEPTVLAIADNGQYIYVGFSGSATIRKFDVATQAAGLQYALGSDSFLGPYYAADIEVVPGQPNALAVSRRYYSVTPQFAGVAVYDDGVRRTNVVTRAGGEISNKIEFKDGSTLFGYNNETSGYDFNRMTVNSGGLSLSANSGNMPNANIANMDFIYQNNRAYFTNGSIIDVSTTPFALAQFPNANGPVTFDASKNLVCFGHSEAGTIVFKRFNPDTFLLSDSLQINGAFGTVKSITTCGTGCYVLNTSDNHVVFINDGTMATGNDPELNRTISVYPNPAADFISFGTDDSGIKNAVIYDMSGKIVFNGKPSGNKVDVRGIAAGLYLVKLTDNFNTVYTSKIIKQ